MAICGLSVVVTNVGYAANDWQTTCRVTQKFFPKVVGAASPGSFHLDSVYFASDSCG